MNFVAQMQKVLLHPGATMEMRHNTNNIEGGEKWKITTFICKEM